MQTVADALGDLFWRVAGIGPDVEVVLAQVRRAGMAGRPAAHPLNTALIIDLRSRRATSVASDGRTSAASQRRLFRS